MLIELEQYLQHHCHGHAHGSATSFLGDAPAAPDPGKEVIITLGKSTTDISKKGGFLEDIHLACRGNELVLAQAGPPLPSSGHKATFAAAMFTCENGNPCQSPYPTEFLAKTPGVSYATCTSGVNKIYLYKDQSTLDHLERDYESRFSQNYGGRDLALGYVQGKKTGEVYLQAVHGKNEGIHHFLSS